MGHRHIPGLARWRCDVCGKPTDQRHHTIYPPWRNELDEQLCLIPLCEDHHSDLHHLHDFGARRATLSVLSAAYTANPARTAVTCGRNLNQLSFGDQIGPAGEHWREVEAWNALLNSYMDLEDVA